MRVMYGASFSKLITPMDSPHQGLSNGILFVKFRYRLDSFSFFEFTSVEEPGWQREIAAIGRKRAFLSPWGPVAVIEMEGKG
jgi:hypothetical protein